MRSWQVQEAKQRLSELLRAVGDGEPQMITRHGAPIAVVVDIDDYRATHPDESRPTFAEFLMSAPQIDGFELPERHRDPDRTAGLFES